MDIDEIDPSSFLSSLSKTQHLSTHTVEDLKEIQYNYDLKLWHPLTLQLLNFFMSSENVSIRMSLFQHVVKTISTFIEPVSLVKLAILASETLGMILLCSL